MWDYISVIFVDRHTVVASIEINSSVHFVLVGIRRVFYGKCSSGKLTFQVRICCILFFR